MPDERDYWTETTFVHYGNGYQLTENLTTVCIGEIASKETAQNSHQTAQDSEKPVASVITGKNLRTNIPHAQMLHPKKSPKRNDALQSKSERFNATSNSKLPAVHRTTLWRRKKKAEQQGVLL